MLPMVALALILGVGVLGIVALLVGHFSGGERTVHAPGGVASENWGRASPSTEPGNTITVNPAPPSIAPRPPNDFWANVPSLLWPLVAIIAIVALFLIAWKAISTGSNVTITWKVTEKVQGRVVITKVRERTTGRRAAA